MTRATLVLVPALAAAAACKGGPAAPSAGSATVTIVQSSVSLGDRHIVSDSTNRLSILFSIYEPLVALDDSGAYRPSLAERWVVADDARTWTFTLRQGVSFHNGGTLQAGDVVASIRRALDPAIGGAFGTQGVLASYLATADVRALDAATVRIVTAEPMADLLDLMSAILIGPEGALADLPRWTSAPAPTASPRCRTSGSSFAPTSGTGPGAGLQRDSLRRGTRCGQARGGPRARGRRHRLRHRRRGQGAPRGGGRRDGPRTRERPLHHLHAECAEGSVQGSPCPSGAELRRGRRRDHRRGEAGSGDAAQWIPTAHHFGFNPETPAYPHDPDQARRLLAEAGYGKGLTLVFDIPSTMPDEAPALTRMMAEQYKRVGITVKTVEHGDRAAYSEMVRDKKINDACCFDSSPRSTFRVLREKLHSTLRGPWWEGYANPRVDALIAKAQATVSDAERQKIDREIYTIVRDDAPWVFLYRPTNYWGARATVAGWTPRADGLLVLR